MYAIIDNGGRQFKVEAGDCIDVDLCPLDEGQETLVFERVLLVGGQDTPPRIGTPTVAGAKVTASILGEIKGDKLVIQKFRRRKNYRRRTGHRQRFLKVRIDAIET